jgi:hypothetical protein
MFKSSGHAFVPRLVGKTEVLRRGDSPVERPLDIHGPTGWRR